MITNHKKGEIDEILERYNMFDTKGNKLTINENGEYSGIPEKCIECHCSQNENYKDFSCKSIHICEQCGTEYYLYF